MILFIKYHLKLLSKAWEGTKSFGKRFGFLGLLITFLPGAFIHSWALEWKIAPVVEQFHLWIAYSVLSGLALLLVAFFTNWILSPFNIDKEQNEKINELEFLQEKERIRQEIANGLARHLEECHQFILEKLSVENFLEWMARWKKWNDEVEIWIESNMTSADLIQYRYSDLVPVNRLEWISDEYRQDICFLRGKADTLRIMMKHRLYANI